jgi:hypothetical protein
MDKRSFTVIAVEDVHGKKKGKANLGGRFLSTTPSGAVKKAASQICRNSAIKGRCTLVITMRETTSGSQHKEYTYKVSRIYDPVTVVRDGVEITYNYSVEVERM